MLHTACTIATYTLREALRNRLGWILGAMLLAAAGLGGFLHQLALTESREVVVTLLAALLRIGAVLLIATLVVTSLTREANDKGQEMLLALAVPRSAYLLGKLAGFCFIAVLPALLFGAMALTLAPPAASALWAVSLLCELWIVAAFALLCALSFGQVLSSLAATLAFYVLARSITAMQSIGAEDQWAQQVVGAIALVLPRLDQFARADWLAYAGAGSAELLTVLTQTALYVTLLGAAASVDLYRKNI